MQGVAGHSVVSAKVEFNCLNRRDTEFRSIRLAADDDDDVRKS